MEKKFENERLAPAFLYPNAKRAFINRTLDYVYIPANVKYIAPGTFEGCPLEYINVDSKNTVYDSRNNCNCIIETKTNKIVQGSANSTIPGNIKVIGEKAFSGISAYGINHFPSTLVKIEDKAFKNAELGMRELIFPKSLKSIGNHAFVGFHFWGSVKFQEGLETIGDGAFSLGNDWNWYIGEVRIPKSLRSLGGGVFAGREIEKLTVKPGNKFYYSDENRIIKKHEKNKGVRQIRTRSKYTMQT